MNKIQKKIQAMNTEARLKKTQEVQEIFRIDKWFQELKGCQVPIPKNIPLKNLSEDERITRSLDHVLNRCWKVRIRFKYIFDQLLKFWEDNQFLTEQNFTDKFNMSHDTWKESLGFFRRCEFIAYVKPHGYYPTTKFFKWAEKLPLI